MMADNNRNWSLVFAQFSWLVLGANWEFEEQQEPLCHAFGAIQHLTWLCVFMWTGIFLSLIIFVIAHVKILT